MNPQTYTYTWTQTRIETIQDQFRYLLIYGDIGEEHTERVLSALADKAIVSVGLYGKDSSQLRVVEIELQVDWSLNAELTLTVPKIAGGLPGWDGKQAPEVRVAGKRFAETVNNLGLSIGWWIGLASWIKADARLNAEWQRKLHMSGNSPAWKSPPQERSESFLDINEATIFIRRASDQG
jgi:hypothetical protein